MKSPWTPSEIFRFSEVKRPIPLLHAAFDLFRGDNTSVVLQGDLRYFDHRGLTVVDQEPKGWLAQVTRPVNAIVEVALNLQSQTLLERILFTRAGIHTRINHLLILKSDELVFASYDRFYEDCVWVTAAVREAWVAALQLARIITAYEHIATARERSPIVLDHVLSKGSKE